MQNELGIRSLRTLRKIMKCYSEDTVVKTLDLLGHEDGILALEKLMEKELPELNKLQPNTEQELVTPGKPTFYKLANFSIFAISVQTPI